MESLPVRSNDTFGFIDLQAHFKDLNSAYSWYVKYVEKLLPMMHVFHNVGDDDEHLEPSNDQSHVALSCAFVTILVDDRVNFTEPYHLLHMGDKWSNVIGDPATFVIDDKFRHLE